jgi:hypothetical protein
MKYLIMIYSSPATWNALSEEERDRVVREHGALIEELIETGEWLGGNPLDDPAKAVAVRVRDGVRHVTDGPYAEVKEHLAGYDLIECDSLERAVEIAGRLPEAAVCGVEVRPIMDLGGLEM